MPLADRVQVQKCHDMIVLMEDMGGQVSVGDLAEQAVFHGGTFHCVAIVLGTGSDGAQTAWNVVCHLPAG